MVSSARTLNGGPRLDGVRVLIVDDVPEVLEVVACLLMRNGARVTAVDTAEEALARLQRDRPDVLLSDLAMPVKGGYWLIGQVRALSPERGGLTPAVALTAFAGEEHRASIVRAGFQLYVEKPGLKELIDAIATLALREEKTA